MRRSACHLQNAALEQERGVGAAADGDKASALQQRFSVRAPLELIEYVCLKLLYHVSESLSGDALEDKVGHVDSGRKWHTHRELPDLQARCSRPRSSALTHK
jgi:hypothetical protein